MAEEVEKQNQASTLMPQPLSGEVNQIEYGGAILNIPVEWDDNKIGLALKRFRDSPEFYDLIDTETGVDIGASHAVGVARTQKDKLATLKKFYPDSVPYGEDNFVFTHHETGKPTLFNPEGFDIGDVARHSKEIAVGVGSTLGAAFGGMGGFAIGAPAGPAVAVTTPKGALWGAGLGAAVTSTFYDFLVNQFSGTVDTRSLGQRTVDVAVEGLAASSGERVGQIAGEFVSKGAKKILGGGTRRAKQAFDALTALNIRPTAGVVTAGKGAGKIEAALEQAAPSATMMRESIERVIQETEQAAKAVAAKVGKPSSQQETGVIIQKAAKGAVERYKKTQTILEDKLEALIGGEVITPITALRALREGFERRVAKAPKSLGPKYAGAIKEIKNIEADAAAAGGLPYSVFREHRSTLGKKMADFNEKSSNKALWKRMYGQMSKDLEELIDAYGPSVKAQFKETMAFTRRWNDENADLFERLIEMDAPEKAYRYLMNTRKDGGTVLAKLQNLFKKDEWDDISATVVQKLGYKNFGNEADDAFSVATFLTNYKSIAEEAKDAFFRGARSKLREELDNLAGVFKNIQDNARLTNFSNTAGAAHTLDTLAHLGYDTTSMAASVATGQPTVQAAKSLVGNIAGRILMPRQVAKLITNPNFVKWLATPVTRTGGIASHIGRLAAVAKASPEIREEVHEFLQILSESDGPEPANLDPGESQVGDQIGNQGDDDIWTTGDDEGIKLHSKGITPIENGGDEGDTVLTAGTDSGQPQAELRSYDPTLRESGIAKGQDFLIKAGIDKHRARSFMEDLLGREGKFAPTDLLGIGEVFGIEEGIRQFKRGKQSDNVKDQVIGATIAILSVLPGVVGGAFIAKRLKNAFNSGNPLVLAKTTKEALDLPMDESRRNFLKRAGGTAAAVATAATIAPDVAKSVSMLTKTAKTAKKAGIPSPASAYKKSLLAHTKRADVQEELFSVVTDVGEYIREHKFISEFSDDLAAPYGHVPMATKMPDEYTFLREKNPNEPGFLTDDALNELLSEIEMDMIDNVGSWVDHMSNLVRQGRMSPKLAKEFKLVSRKIEDADKGLDAAEKGLDEAASKIFSEGRILDISKDGLPKNLKIVSKKETINEPGYPTKRLELVYKGKRTGIIAHGGEQQAIKDLLTNTRDLLIRYDVDPILIKKILKDPELAAQAQMAEESGSSIMEFIAKVKDSVK